MIVSSKRGVLECPSPTPTQFSSHVPEDHQELDFSSVLASIEHFQPPRSRIFRANFRLHILGYAPYILLTTTSLYRCVLFHCKQTFYQDEANCAFGYLVLFVQTASVGLPRRRPICRTHQNTWYILEVSSLVQQSTACLVFLLISLVSSAF
ncbi:hypothetical protein EDB82DRAFT_23551 [Fusarium venenatum]|uniref:uncharacterized protein n=1 Tax=Fusarium venenatum TaxID=56646 RepID=UPI001DE526C1|nr:hypothetical protein EDB82DRAFT_23551 [Fusarium venenatum]